jgi:glutamate--cysteine ligase
MLAHDDEKAGQPIESRAELVAYLESGCKPETDWRIGTEHEKFGFHTADLTPVPYEGPSGIEALLKEMCARFGWEPIYEGECVIALKDPHCGAGGSITLEPGGQFELSGAPLRTGRSASACSASAFRRNGPWRIRRACPRAATRS